MRSSITSSSSVAVIGAGAMGAGIAQVAAAAGHSVKLYDMHVPAAQKAIDNIRGNYQRLVVKNRMSADQAEAAGKRLSIAEGLEALSGTVLVIEAIAENLDIKRDLFVRLEKIVEPDAILATNTSSISITAIAAPLKVPGRLVGMHFFNPAPLMPLVEVVSGLATSDHVAQAVFDIATAWGKTPVYTKSTPGFIVNRVARPFYAEGLRLLYEQVAEPATIDAIMRESGGFRMGPFELMDLIGHDVNFAVTKSVFDSYYQDPRFTPSLIQQELVNAGFLGRKTGRGFYQYGNDAPPITARDEPPIQPPAAIVIRQQGTLTAALVERLSNTTIEVRTQSDSGPDVPLLETEDALVYVTDGRCATLRAYQMQKPNVVLVDLALDYGKAKRIALTRARQCSDSAWQAVVGVFQAAGYIVSSLLDTPAMAVMRTVAMLANEAADAVNQGVCTVAGVDVAMQGGVNYPNGPLAWADAVGVATIHTVLTNLAQHYGEDRYRVSPLLRSKVWENAGFHG